MSRVRPRVVVAYKSLPAYRETFFSTLRDALDADGVDFHLVYGNAFGADRLKADTVELPWATYRSNRVVSVAGRQLCWQPVRDVVRGADLVIVEQASKLLLNYPLLASQRMRVGPRVALWGHGANLQRHTASWVSEAAKKRYSRLPWWWFAYTDGSRDRVVELGYPASRVTVVQNAVDTRTLAESVRAVPADALARFRAETGSVEGATALFIGSLYADKRLPFLVAAGDRLAASMPEFRLLVAGDGPDRPVVESLAAHRPWLRYLGRVDGFQRALALRAASAVLMPGLVGLAILDAFAGEAPLVTTAVDFHSPEIEYLTPGVNGVCVAPADDVDAYAAEVTALLRDGVRLRHLQAGCRAAAARYTNDEMVRRFAAGVHGALER